MQYRSFPKIPELNISCLGFGAMRLPVLEREPARIDEEAATALLRAAVRAKINYFDTAWVYHGGNSERVLGQALAPFRDSVLIASKCPVWEVASESDFERILDLQLTRLGTSQIDFYLFHALDLSRWEKVKQLNGLAALERARNDGRIRHLGFSFHGPLDEFRTIVDGYSDWEFCQIQLNYIDHEFQAGLAGLAYARERRIGVISMEPLRGGALSAVPAPVQRVFSDAGRNWSPAAWALRWVWNQAGVVTALSGMGASEQLADNVASAQSALPLSHADENAIEQARQFFQAKMAVACTTCGYCQPCPAGVSIPEVFDRYNSGRMFDNAAASARLYRLFLLNHQRGADQCLNCGDCEAKCPQHLAIAEELDRAHAYLTGALSGAGG